MATAINWEKGQTCAEHWTKGYWENTEDLPEKNVERSKS